MLSRCQTCGTGVRLLVVLLEQGAVQCCTEHRAERAQITGRREEEEGGGFWEGQLSNILKCGNTHRSRQQREMEYEAARRRHMGPVMDHQAAYGGQGGLPTQTSLGRGGPYPSMDANGKAVYRNRQEEMRDPDFHRPRCAPILFVVKVLSCLVVREFKESCRKSRPCPPLCLDWVPGGVEAGRTV